MALEPAAQAVHTALLGPFARSAMAVSGYCNNAVPFRSCKRSWGPHRTQHDALKQAVHWIWRQYVQLHPQTVSQAPSDDALAAAVVELDLVFVGAVADGPAASAGAGELAAAAKAGGKGRGKRAAPAAAKKAAAKRARSG